MKAVVLACGEVFGERCLWNDLFLNRSKRHARELYVYFRIKSNIRKILNINSIKNCQLVWKQSASHDMIDIT